MNTNYTVLSIHFAYGYALYHLQLQGEPIKPSSSTCNEDQILHNVDHQRQFREVNSKLCLEDNWERRDPLEIYGEGL